MKNLKCEVRREDWAARSDKPRRSIFLNFKSEMPGAPPDPAQARCDSRNNSPPRPTALGPQALQAAIDVAIARAFLYQFLARSFEDPALGSWTWLTDANTQAAFHSAVRALRGNGSTNVEESATALTGQLRCDHFEPFQASFVTAFGHAARGDCPLNEIEYGDLKADPLFQPHRLADLAAFYRAFGLEVANGAAERPDHIGMELEFMAVLAAKEAYAHEHQFDGNQLAVCHDAQKKFLREHLGRWSPGFARRLARAATDGALTALAEFTRDFIVAECARFGLTAGSEDLLVRPVDEAAESLCASCGLQNLPPGAATAGATT